MNRLYGSGHIVCSLNYHGFCFRCYQLDDFIRKDNPVYVSRDDSLLYLFFDEHTHNGIVLQRGDENLISLTEISLNYSVNC